MEQENAEKKECKCEKDCSCEEGCCEMKNESCKCEQIGFHKGSLSTLAKEREEFGKVLGVVEQLMQMHVEALKKLGVDLEEQAKNAQAEQTPAHKKPEVPIDDFLTKEA